MDMTLFGLIIDLNMSYFMDNAYFQPAKLMTIYLHYLIETGKISLLGIANLKSVTAAWIIVYTSS